MIAPIDHVDAKDIRINDLEERLGLQRQALLPRREAIRNARPVYVTDYARELAGEILDDISDERENDYYLARWIDAILALGAHHAQVEDK